MATDSILTDNVEAKRVRGSLRTVRPPRGKRILAGRLGMTPESLSRSLKKLRKYGVTERAGVVTIKDISRLRKFYFAGEDPSRMPAGSDPDRLACAPAEGETGRPLWTERHTRLNTRASP